MPKSSTRDKKKSNKTPTSPAYIKKKSTGSNFDSRTLEFRVSELDKHNASFYKNSNASRHFAIDAGDAIPGGSRSIRMNDMTPGNTITPGRTPGGAGNRMKSNGQN